MSGNTPERYDDEESPDARGGLDVTPRTGSHSSSTRRADGTRKVLAIGGVAVVLAVLGVVLFNGLNDAALFYYNVDEAIERRDELGDKRFRMQGNVIEGSIVETAEGVEFTIAYSGSELPVRHIGDPPELFSPDIPVIIEGNFGPDGFESDEILIRHDSTYTEKYEDRLQDAKDDVQDRVRSAG